MIVFWNPNALDQLSDIYVQLGLDDQRVLATAVEEINARLAGSPQFLGESRATALIRLWYTDWLQLLFELIPGGEVEVLRVRDNRPGRRA